jgi:hypothetical protein
LLSGGGSVDGVPDGSAPDGCVSWEGLDEAVALGSVGSTVDVLLVVPVGGDVAGGAVLEPAGGAAPSVPADPVGPVPPVGPLLPVGPVWPVAGFVAPAVAANAA